MLDAVGDAQVGCPEGNVVTECLVEYPAGKSNGRSFAFDEEPGLSLAVEDDEVETAAQAVELYFALDSDERSRITFLVDEVVYQVLAHPLLRGEQNVFLAEDVEDMEGAILLFHVIGERRQGQWLHIFSF